VATEAAWLNGNNLEKEEKEEERNRGKNQRKALTLAGLLMEGLRVFDRRTVWVVLGVSSG
jgi:hypothetical protein